MPQLTDFVDEFCEALKTQIAADQERWGDTWLNRPRFGQENRIRMTLDNYWAQFTFGNQPIPWLKVAGEALIAWVRENHPELSNQFVIDKLAE